MQYVWLLWSIMLLITWFILYFSLKDKKERKRMFIVSLWTSLLGFTEPIFVPAYWNPPSLFDLAIKTGFDIESFLFAFGIGGIVFIAYNRLFGFQLSTMSSHERSHSRHRIHIFALLSAPVTFAILFFATDLNPMHSAIIGLVVGGILAWYCRPDLKVKMLISAALFTALYYVYFITLLIAFPGYVEQVWNLNAISGVFITGIPIEELLFAASFGFIWSSIYEHITWRKGSRAGNFIG